MSILTVTILLLKGTEVVQIFLYHDFRNFICGFKTFVYQMQTYYFFIPWNSHVGIHVYQYVLLVKPEKKFLKVWYTWFLFIWIAGWYNKVHMVLRFPVFGHVRSRGGGTFFFLIGKIGHDRSREGTYGFQKNHSTKNLYISSNLQQRITMYRAMKGNSLMF